MTLVTFAATQEWVRYAKNTDDISRAYIAHRVNLVTWLERTQRTGQPIHLADWTLDETDITALLNTIRDAAQDIRDAYIEKARERRADLATNWE